MDCCTVHNIDYTLPVDEVEVMVLAVDYLLDYSLFRTVTDDLIELKIKSIQKERTKEEMVKFKKRFSLVTLLNQRSNDVS